MPSVEKLSDDFNSPHTRRLVSKSSILSRSILRFDLLGIWVERAGAIGRLTRDSSWVVVTVHSGSVGARAESTRSRMEYVWHDISP